MLEIDIEMEILNWLAKDKTIFAWKNHSVGIYDEKKKVYRKSKNPYAIDGVSDILGIYQGRFFAIEVKKDCSAKKRKGQVVFCNKINSMGGYACFVTSLEQAQSFVRMMKEFKLREEDSK